MGLLDRRYRVPGEQEARSPKERARIRANADDRALERLRDDGVDLTRPQRLQLAIRMPTHGVASKAAAPLRESFEIEIERTDLQDGSCDVFATCEMLLEERAVYAVSRRFDELAQEAGGRYRGWRLAP
jgi:hypothetical protein